MDQITLEKILKVIRSGFDELTTPFMTRWLKISEASKYAKMSKNTMMGYIRSGDIYATKKGGNWIVDRKSIDDFYDHDRNKLLELKGRLKI